VCIFAAWLLNNYNLDDRKGWLFLGIVKLYASDFRLENLVGIWGLGESLIYKYN